MNTDPVRLPVEKTGKSHILKRFPTHWATIITLFEENEEFRSLSDEYGLVLDALSRIEGLLDSRARNMRDEYRAIIFELESEIHNYIDEQTLSVCSSLYQILRKPEAR